jgi:hypothetical protein
MKAVELALLDISTCFESISKDSGSRTIHQRLLRHLHLAAPAAEYVAIWPRMSPPGTCCGWPGLTGTGLSWDGDLDRTNNDRLEARRRCQGATQIWKHLSCVTLSRLLFRFFSASSVSSIFR